MARVNSSKAISLICASVVLAFILRLLPLPHWAIWLRPQWVAMVCIFWAISPPHRLGVGVAWCLGLLLDVMSGTVLGEHALSLTLLCYLAQHLHVRLPAAPWLQQGSVIFGLVLLHQILLYLIQGQLGVDVPLGLFWLPALTSMLLWPWLNRLLTEWFLLDTNE